MEKQKLYRAGMVCYRKNNNDEIEMLFMKPSDPNWGGNEFQIPKGKLDPGEDAYTAAVREATEEVGLFRGCIIKGPELLGEFLGRTTIYVCKVRPDALFGEPSFETSETKWMTLKEFDEVGRPLHRPIIKAAHRMIMKLES